MRVAVRECWSGMAWCMGAAAAAGIGWLWVPAWTGAWQLMLSVSCAGVFTLLFFFRDPERTPLLNERVVLAPADGTVVAVEEGIEHPYVGGRGTRVSIFLSVFNVHVQRAPIDGAVEMVEHRPGRFHAAWHPAASIENEQNVIGIRQPGFGVLLCQIAGVLARRTVSWVGVGDRVRAGDRVGLIKFGSRVDLYLPASVEVVVKLRERVRGGMTVVGVMG